MADEPKRYHYWERKSHIFQEHLMPRAFEEFFRQKILKRLQLRGNNIAMKEQLALHSCIRWFSLRLPS